MTNPAHVRGTSNETRERSLPTEAKFFLALVAALGATVLEIAALQWKHPHVWILSAYLMLCIMGAMWKVKLPGMTSTMSVSFLFVLLGIVALSFSEAVLIGCASALVQSIWEAKRPPKLTQIVFNISSWAISVGLASAACHYMRELHGFKSPLAFLSLGAAVFFATHTVLLSAILSLNGEGPFGKIWQQFLRWSLPYYAVGTALACAVSLCSRSLGWSASLLTLLPSIYFSYTLYRDYVGRQQKVISI